MHRFVILAAVLISACDGTSHPVANMTLDVPENIRTVQAVNRTTVFAEVILNNDSPFTVSMGNQSPVVFSAPGVILNDDNDYSITWYEQIQHVRLALSTQNGSFFADPETRRARLSDDHVYDVHDANNNRMSNLSERISGMCPWVACDTEGGLMRPTQLTQLTALPDQNFTLVRTTGSRWTETAASGEHFWVETSSTDTSISFVDTDRGVLLEIDLIRGLVNYNEPNNNDEFVLIYKLRSGF